MIEYESVSHDLSLFGINKINNIIVNIDGDDNISVKVSFDGGKSFYGISELNKKIKIDKENPIIVVKLYFKEPDVKNIYMVKTSGFFQNYGIGTEITFIKKTSGDSFVTKLGWNGKYQVFLARGIYDVYFKNDNGGLEQITTNFNPETTIDIPTHRLDKENTVEQFLRGIEWAKYCIFDVFDDNDKMVRGSSYVDINGDICDFETNTVCRYWAIGFD